MSREKQWETALRRGNAIRLARAEIRRALKRGRIDIRDALEHPAVQTMPVYELLAYLPAHRGRGRGKQPRPAKALARELAAAVWINSETLPVAALSQPRRDRVAEVVWQRVPGCRVPLDHRVERKACCVRRHEKPPD